MNFLMNYFDEKCQVARLKKRGFTFIRVLYLQTFFYFVLESKLNLREEIKFPQLLHLMNETENLSLYDFAFIPIYFERNKEFALCVIDLNKRQILQFTFL